MSEAVKSLNLTGLNSTSPLMTEREIDMEELLQLLDEESSSTNGQHSANCSCECEMVKPVDNGEVQVTTSDDDKLVAAADNSTLNVSKVRDVNKVKSLSSKLTLLLR